MDYRTPEQRRYEKELQYHLRCIEQYTESAIQLERFPKMQQRAMDNAQFHRRKLNAMREPLAA